ncbi:MAG: hypothetical protein CFE29_08960 [Bradyrhizobiaceae bacterium PARB1]|nr:MAG: hypothetical protein CFE29_08960 [Bradyrhizobiaceae bacterium PARB1]
MVGGNGQSSGGVAVLGARQIRKGLGCGDVRRCRLRTVGQAALLQAHETPLHLGAVKIEAAEREKRARPDENYLNHCSVSNIGRLL